MKPRNPGWDPMTVGRIVIVNPNDRNWTPHRYVLWFGAYGSTYLAVYAKGLDTALDIAVDYLAEHFPGFLATKEVNEEYTRLIATGMSEEQAMEGATADMTCAGNCGDYLPSWEWGIISENMPRAAFLALASGQ